MAKKSTKKDRTPNLHSLYEAWQRAIGYVDGARLNLDNHLALHYKIKTPSVGAWGCEESPIGVCVYDDEADPCNDECLVCGHPDERK